MINRQLLLFFIFFSCCLKVTGSVSGASSENKSEKHFIISRNGQSASIVTDSSDWKGVQIAARNLAEDIGKVTGVSSEIKNSIDIPTHQIIAGTIGKSAFIDSLISSGKLDVNEIRGEWESYLTEVIDGNLVIAGSDKRGTIYGIYDLSRQIGVSPWHFWADVPINHNDELIYSKGRYIQPSPKVKYRGIFINDEWPSFGGWATNYFGGINSGLYCSIFDLLLRLKANYMWPAMWDSRFNEDDPDSPRLADEYGIVMGTSHHEPMMRAHKEYVYRKDSIGEWDYSTNKDNLDRFFREGMERNRDYENLVTIGMRGDGDVAMGRGDDEENIRVLHDVIYGQRKIISDIYGREDAVPQLWAVFTEVQRYYDAGFTVPDDVTILLCDNNWGYIRRKAPQNNGKNSYGLYYHIDMNGGPWNDRWVNTSPLPKIREQLNLAYRSGIDDIWIINVGDLKPKELPIDFIMNYAWDPDQIGPGQENQYLTEWASTIFGEDNAENISEILSKYPKYNLWRKPEVQIPGIFSVDNYNEIERVDSIWQYVVDKADSIRNIIPEKLSDAYYQFVYYPAVASATVAQLYNAVTANYYYSEKNDTRANLYADKARELFVKDSVLTAHYNTGISGGKWNGMMQDKHIGYSQWFMPDKNILPELKKVTGKSTPQTSYNSAPSDEFAIEAMDYSRNMPKGELSWIFLPDLGRGEGCMGSSDVMANAMPDCDGPTLEYDIDLPEADSVRIAIGILPTQDVLPSRGLRLGVAIDNEISIIDARQGFVDTFMEYTADNLSRSKVLSPLPPSLKMTLNGYGKPMRNEIFDNIRWLYVKLPVNNSTDHTLKIIMIDPEIVVERIVVNPDDSKYSYFGPPSKKHL